MCGGDHIIVSISIVHLFLVLLESPRVVPTSVCSASGLIVANIMVLQFPPRLSRRTSSDGVNNVIFVKNISAFDRFM